MKEILKFKAYECEYFTYGKGKNILFTFHGYGNHASDFGILESLISNEYTIVSINLFFHGNGTISEELIEKGFSEEDLVFLISHFFKKFPSEKYSLIGYSLGGRIALKILELLPEKIEQIILIAPDGLKTHPFYRFLVSPSGKKIFRNITTDPSRIQLIIRFLQKIGVVHEKKLHWAQSHFNTLEKRQKVYNVWMIYRFLQPRLSKIKSSLIKYEIRTDLFFGRYDQIIRKELGKRLLIKKSGLVRIHIIQGGHRLLQSSHLKEITGLLKYQ